MKDLPLTFLLGYPFFLERGAIFDLNNPTVVLTKTNLKPSIQLILTSSDNCSMFDMTNSLMDNHSSTQVNAIFCNFNKQDDDIIDDEADTQLRDLLQEFDSVFNLTDKTPANFPKIDLKLKPEFANKIFYQPEPIRSTADQAIIYRSQCS